MVNGPRSSIWKLCSSFKFIIKSTLDLHVNLHVMTQQVVVTALFIPPYDRGKCFH